MRNQSTRFYFIVLKYQDAEPKFVGNNQQGYKNGFYAMNEAEKNKEPCELWVGYVDKYNSKLSTTLQVGAERIRFNPFYFVNKNQTAVHYGWRPQEYGEPIER